MRQGESMTKERNKDVWQEIFLEPLFELGGRIDEARNTIEEMINLAGEYKSEPRNYDKP